jgi:hypothetical protein
MRLSEVIASEVSESIAPLRALGCPASDAGWLRRAMKEDVTAIALFAQSDGVNGFNTQRSENH